jgi:hypothetical protein
MKPIQPAVNFTEIAQLAGSIVTPFHKYFSITSEIVRYSLSPNHVSLSSILYAKMFFIISNVELASIFDKSRLANI